MSSVLVPLTHVSTPPLIFCVPLLPHPHLAEAGGTAPPGGHLSPRDREQAGPPQTPPLLHPLSLPPTPEHCAPAWGQQATTTGSLGTRGPRNPLNPSVLDMHASPRHSFQETPGNAQPPSSPPSASCPSQELLGVVSSTRCAICEDTHCLSREGFS